jgi:hypothetical protein
MISTADATTDAAPREPPTDGRALEPRGPARSPSL